MDHTHLAVCNRTDLGIITGYIILNNNMGAINDVNIPAIPIQVGDIWGPGG